MSKRTRETRRSRRNLGTEDKALRSLEEDQKTSLLSARSDDSNPQTIGRWVDVKDGPPPLPPSTRRRGDDSSVAPPDIPSRPTGSEVTSPDNISLAESLANSSTTTIPRGKRFKDGRDASTPTFVTSFDMDNVNLQTPDSVFKWARTEEPSDTISPPKGRGETDTDVAGTVPVQQPRVEYIQPVHEHQGVLLQAVHEQRRIESPPSSDCSELFIENAVEKELMEANDEVMETSDAAGMVDSGLIIDQELAKAESFPKEAQDDNLSTGISNAPIIVIPIATLVGPETSDGNVTGAADKKKMWYKRRSCWLFVLVQIIVLAVVVAVVLSLRGRDDKESRNAEVDFTLSPTVTPVRTTAAPTMLRTTPAPVVGALAPLEFPELPDTFFDTYVSTLTWLGRDEMREGDPELPRFVLAWFWYHTTENSSVPWSHCNPKSGSEQCEFLSNISVNDLDLCYTSKLPANRWLASASECTWAGVSCNESGFVTSISLPGIGLHGDFPFFLNRLPFLEQLNLSFGNLQGMLPTDIGKFLSLKILDMSYNFLAGPLPDELGSLTNLRKLSLASNSLTGTSIPLTLSGLSNLEHLDLSSCSLGGIIPHEFAGLTKMVNLDLHENYLVGGLPTLEWPFLETLHVASNNLDGMFPSEIL